MSVWKKAFHETVPVMFGYLFAASAFGLMLQQAGYSIWWSVFIGVTVYCGTMQYVLVGLLSGGASVLTTIETTLAVNSRHLFYGISFLEKFKAMGLRRFYMMFSLSDETYTLLNFVKTPKDMEEKKLFFAIAFLDQCYWVTGCILGTAVGQLITFDITGVDFAMTAMFVVIFVEKWLETKVHFHMIAGLICGAVALVIFGPDNFIIPALVVTVFILLFSKKNMERRLHSEKDSSDRKDSPKEEETCQSQLSNL